MSKDKSVRMRFNADMFYNEECIYQNGKEYDVPLNMVDRWLKRGGIIVKDSREALKESETKASEIVREPSKMELDLLSEPDAPAPLSNVDESLQEDVEDKKEKPEDKGHGNKPHRGYKGNRRHS